MDLEAVPHAQRHRPCINAPQVASEAVAVAELASWLAVEVVPPEPS